MNFLPTLCCSSVPLPSSAVPLWWNISTQYYGQNGQYVSKYVTLKQEMDAGYSHGIFVGPIRTDSIINDTINSGALPWDPNGLYLLLTDPIVRQVGDVRTSPTSDH